jgi:hypothetical protein
MSSRPKCSLRWSGILRKSFFPRGATVARCASILALMLMQQVLAQANLPVPRREEETPRELDVPLPEYPSPASLLPFPTNWTTNSIFVDRNSLNVAEDGVVRFALVVRSASGAETVSFEGIRCATGERRVFAYGRNAADGGVWTPARGSGWRQIADSRVNRHYYEFWRDVFCDGNSTESRAEILKHIASGGRTRHRSLN